MRVDRRAADTCVPEDDLDRPQVGAGFEEMGREGVPFIPDAG
jgi:hypothetical protein